MVNFSLAGFALWFTALLAAIVLGILLGLGVYPAVLVLFAMLVGIMFIVYPSLGVWAVILGVLVASGLIDLYLPSLYPAVWAFPILSMIIAGIAIVRHLFGRKDNPNKIGKQASIMIIWAFLFVLCTVYSSLANWSGASNFVIGLKGYFQAWGLMAAIYFITKDEEEARKLIMFFLPLGLLQLPFVLHQFLVLVPLRSTNELAEKFVVAGDIVAGTFGGKMWEGGRSPNLAVLCVISITIALALWRADLIKKSRAMSCSFLFLFPMFLSEAKIFLMLLPVALFLLFRDYITRSFLKAAMSLVAVCVLLIGIFFAYSLLPGAKSQRASSLEEMLDQNIAYNLGNRGYGGDLLNRTTVYPFWLNQHTNLDSAASAVFGHGLSQTSGGTALNGRSLAKTHYDAYGIGLTGLSALLWEVGLFGTLVVLAMFFSAYRLGGQLAERWQGTKHWPTIKSAQIAVPLFAISLAHNNYFVFDIGFQTMMVIIFGYLLVMARIEKKLGSQ